MKRLLTISIFICLTLPLLAVRGKTQHNHSHPCIPTAETTRGKVIRKVLNEPYTNWDPRKTYRVPVLLMSFDDLDFSIPDPLSFYDRLFNQTGINAGGGPGSVADYFRDQSAGQFNVRFDIVGPIRSPYSHDKCGDYGRIAFEDIVEKSDSQLNYADYDWDGDGDAEAAIIIYAGYGGNDAEEDCIWPNTDNLYVTLDGVDVYAYSASPELWSDDTSCGIGTVCHEFSHVLGIPDFYPTSGTEFSVLDEWDLMDGGNYSGKGWCPPNYSAHERMYLNWLTPEELTTSTKITDMPSFNSSGKAYRIVNEAKPTEYYLLENRQWEGWDMMLPSHGLLITHVDFNKMSWIDNIVNINKNHHRLEFFCADNHDFNYYDKVIGRENVYDEDGRSLRMRHTSYPYTNEEGITNNALTDTSTPAAKLFNARKDGILLMGQPITDITEDNGKISFRFTDAATGIVDTQAEASATTVYDLLGRKTAQSEMKSGYIYIIRYSNGETKKVKYNSR